MIKVIKPEDLVKIDKLWRAANYLTVAFMYLRSNVFLHKKLSVNDITDHPAGHWGTSPGINFILAHLNYYIKYYEKDIQLVIGPGHAGNALFANLVLDGTLQEKYCLSNNESRMFEIEKVHECLQRIRTEISPYMPGTVYDGGELGYSLPVSFGAVTDFPDRIAVCIIGDGEFETGTISSAWRCKEYLDNSSGIVLPIIHLNEFRMGKNSLLSQYSEKSIYHYFRSMGYNARFVRQNHAEMANALKWAHNVHKKIKDGTQHDWPVIVFRSVKGNSIPAYNGIQIAGTPRSHKNPLDGLSKEEIVKFLPVWLNGYKPYELFDSHGNVLDDIRSIIPSGNRRIGKTIENYPYKDTIIPNISIYAVEKIQKEQKCSCMVALDRYLLNICKRNPDSFLVLSPDELMSNYLYNLASSAERTIINRDSNHVIEILNENICQAWLQGYILTGRNGIVISYEAFWPIVGSMVSQFSKWLVQSKDVPWRPNTASLTYVLTSLWETNTYSHQNPEFINLLLNTQHEFIRIYFPIDTNTLLASVNKALSSKNQINTIITTKQKTDQLLNIKEAISAVDNGFVELVCPIHKRKRLDVIIVAIGDYAIRECIASVDLIQECFRDINLEVIAVLELTVLGDRNIYQHALCDDVFNNLFPLRVPVVFVFHGYASAIRMLLFERMRDRSCYILGYKNKSVDSADLTAKLIENEMSRYHIAKKVIEIIKQNNTDNSIIDKNNI